MTSQTKLLDILQINVCCRCRCQKYIVFWLWCISLLNYTKYSNKFLAGQIHIMFSILVWKIIHFISAVNARVNVKNMCYFKMYQLCLSLPPLPPHLPSLSHSHALFSVSLLFCSWRSTWQNIYLPMERSTVKIHSVLSMSLL